MFGVRARAGQGRKVSSTATMRDKLAKVIWNTSLLPCSLAPQQTYEVLLDRAIGPEDCRALSQGVVITTMAQSAKRPLTARTLPCKVYPVAGTGNKRVKITLTEGRNRQVGDNTILNYFFSHQLTYFVGVLSRPWTRKVRKMFRSRGYAVKQLHRAKFMGISCRGLKVGETSQ